MTYKLYIRSFETQPDAVMTSDGNKSFIFAPTNTDYQAFKQDLANGVALSDAEGTAMTADQIKTFLETLP